MSVCSLFAAFDIFSIAKANLDITLSRAAPHSGAGRQLDPQDSIAHEDEKSRVLSISMRRPAVVVGERRHVVLRVDEMFNVRRDRCGGAKCGA